MSRLFLLILLAAVPLGLLQAFSVHEELKSEREEVSQIALRTAKRAAAEQRRVVEGARQMLTALAQIPVIRSGDPALCSAFLRRLRDRFPTYLAIGVSTPAGRIWCSSATPGTDVSDRPYFREVIAAREFSTGGYVVGRIRGGRSLNFSYPFYDNQGRLLGVVIAGLDLKRLTTDLNRAELPRAGRLAIIGPDSRVVLDLPGGTNGGRAVPPPWRNMIKAERAGNIETDWLDGSKRLIAFVPPSKSRELPFLVAVGIDSALAMAPLRDRAREDFGLLLATVAVALLLGWWFATRFVRSPLRRLTSTVRKWREGDGTARVRLLHPGSEFDELARTFNAMAEAVEAVARVPRGRRWLGRRRPAHCYGGEAASHGRLSLEDAGGLVRGQRLPGQ